MKKNVDVRKVLLDPKLRRKLVKDSHYWFFQYYFHHSPKYQTAEFQKEIFKLSGEHHDIFVLEAFRGSAKSTIMSLSYPLWAVLGSPRKKFVILLAKTQSQARLMLKNLKQEIRGNAALRRDLGPFHEEEDEWQAQTIVIPKFDARIMAASSESSLRGLRHRESRPDLVIADDLEDLESVRQQDQRDGLYDWFAGDVVPMGSEGLQIVVLGTRLHEDSLLMRLKVEIEGGRRNGVFRSYPFLNGDGKPLWPERFGTPESIKAVRDMMPDEITYQREFMLTIIADNQRVVRPEWIKRYDVMPSRDHNPALVMSVIGVDLAISEKTSADYTAMVTLSLFYENEKWTAYIHPDPVNERMDFPTGRERIQQVWRDLSGDLPAKILIENVGYQGSMIQDLISKGFPAEEFLVHGQDKRARLQLVTHLVQSGIVLFPTTGCELLERQLVGFGIEKHDDLADAFAMVLHAVLGKITLPALVFPRQETIVPSNEPQSEAQADRAQQLEDEYERSNFNQMMRPRFRGY